MNGRYPQVGYDIVGGFFRWYTRVAGWILPDGRAVSAVPPRRLTIAHRPHRRVSSRDDRPRAAQRRRASGLPVHRLRGRTRRACVLARPSASLLRRGQPAPRALAHQEAYCLSSAFPVCPTFQDWARREAAQARGSSVRGSSARPRPRRPSPPRPRPVRRPRSVRGRTTSGWTDAEPRTRTTPRSRRADGRRPRRRRRVVAAAAGRRPLIRRNPPRDWAAPPPWASSSAAAGAYGRPTAEGDPSAPEFLASRPAAAVAGAGLAGSAADRLASGQPVGRIRPRPVRRAGRSRRRARRTRRAARPAGRPPADGPLPRRPPPRVAVRP